MFGRQHVRVVRKSRGPEAAAVSDASVASLGRCVPPLSGCPLSLQPSTNLALVCRFLSSRDLLSAYKVSHALSAAAASPLTFQHESEWRIDHADKGVETIGPAAVCTGEARLSAALQSRLFRAFRILKIRADKQEEIAVMLQMLQAPDAPKLHVLQIECNLEIAVAKLSALLQFSFLRVLSLRSTSLVSFEGSSFAGLPRLEVFQLSHAVESEDPFVSSDLIGLLKTLPELRTCVFRSALPYMLMNEATESTTLVDVRAMARLEAEVPQLDAIHWLICWSQERTMSEMEEAIEATAGDSDNEPPKPLPTLTKVRSVLMNEVRLHFWPPGGDLAEELEKCPNVFRLLPQLTELRAFVRDEPRFHDDCAKAFLAQLVTAALPLTSLTLLEQTAARAWNQTVVRFFPAWFSALTFLSCNFPITCIRDFAHMPLLHTLRELRYPSDEPERVKTDEPALCFPSLTSLHIDSGLSTRSLYTLIARLPKLNSVARKLNPPQDPQSFIAAGLALIDEREAERVQLEAQAKQRGGWNMASVPTVTHDFVSPPSTEWTKFDGKLIAPTFASTSEQHGPASSKDAGSSSRGNLAQRQSLNEPFEAYIDGRFQTGAKATSSSAKPATGTAGFAAPVAAQPSSSFVFTPAPAMAPAASPFSFSAPAAAFSAPSFGSSSFGSSSASNVSNSSAFAVAVVAPAFTFNPPPATAAAAAAAPLGAPFEAPFNPFAVPPSSAATNQTAATPVSATFNFGSVAAALPNAGGSSQPPDSQ